MPSDSIVNISEGISFNYLIKGTLLAVFSGIVAVFFLPALIGVVVGLALILATSGVEIDCAKKQFRNYAGFLGFKIGNWKDIVGVEKLELEESTQQYTKRTFIMPMAGGWRGETIMHKTYDVSFTTNHGKIVVVNDFDDYNQALKCLAVLERATNLKGVNQYAIETAKIIARRKGRR